MRNSQTEDFSHLRTALLRNKNESSFDERWFSQTIYREINLSCSFEPRADGLTVPSIQSRACPQGLAIILPCQWSFDEDYETLVDMIIEHLRSQIHHIDIVFFSSENSDMKKIQKTRCEINLNK